METRHQVLETHWYGTGIFELVLERNGVTFRPGDCVALFGADGRTSRPYSIASGIDDPHLRFVIRKLNNGAVSAYLSTRTSGDQVLVSPPFGWFHPGSCDEDAPFVFVATGTGIAPFLAYLRSDPGRPPAACLYGVRQAEDTVDLGWLRRQCDLRLTVSRERVGGAHFGRVTDLLADMPCGARHHFYLCGLDTMIDDVSGWLEQHDVPLTHMHRECFFNASCAAP
jgi:ferredoxin-NADP reductase